MTPQDLAEIRELAGLNEPSNIQEQKKWADKQLTNQPIVKDQIPIPKQSHFNISSVKGNTYGGQSGEDKEMENLAERLNKALGNDFSTSISIERL